MTDITLVLIVACWITVYGYWMMAARSRRSNAKVQSPRSAIPHVLLGLAGLALLLAPIRQPPLGTNLWPQSLAVDAVSVALSAAGAAFAIWARKHLGDNWSAQVTVKVEHALIRTGPYRHVRHPIYSGLLLMLFAAALYHGTLAAVLGFLCLAVRHIWKLRTEETFMEETFGDEYKQYRRDVKALIPGIL